MKRLLLAPAIAAALLSHVPSAHAFYTECTIRSVIRPVNRPGGEPDPRWWPLDPGKKVAIRDTYHDWIFVFWDRGEGIPEYGWLRRDDVDHCKSRDGTP